MYLCLGYNNISAWASHCRFIRKAMREPHSVEQQLSDSTFLCLYKIILIAILTPVRYKMPEVIYVIRRAIFAKQKNESKKKRNL